MPKLRPFVIDSALAAAAAFTLIVACGCTAPPPATSMRPVPSGLVTRSYSTADIVRLLQADQNANPDHRGAMPATTRPAELAGAVMARIEPLSWQEAGGRGTVESTEHGILLTQTADVHQRIRNMIRFADSRIELELLLTENLAALIEWERTHPAAWLSQGDAQIWPEPLTQEQARPFLDNQDLNPDGTRMGVSNFTLFSGQRISHFSGQETAYVGDLTPIIGTNAVAFDPTVSIAHSGLSLTCAAEIAGDGKTAILNLRPRLTQLLELVPHPVPAANPPATIEGYVQLPQTSIAEFERTVRVPAGQAVLLKTPLIHHPPPAIAIPPKTLVILVRVSILDSKEHP